MVEKTGTPATDLDGQEGEDTNVHIPLWMYPIIFAGLLAIVFHDKWVEPVSTSLGQLF